MVNFLKGIVAGIGGVSPGLSGSVLLILLGLYHQTLEALGMNEMRDCYQSVYDRIN